MASEIAARPWRDLGQPESSGRYGHQMEQPREDGQHGNSQVSCKRNRFRGHEFRSPVNQAVPDRPGKNSRSCGIAISVSEPGQTTPRRGDVDRSGFSWERWPRLVASSSRAGRGRVKSDMLARVFPACRIPHQSVSQDEKIAPPILIGFALGREFWVQQLRMPSASISACVLSTARRFFVPESNHYRVRGSTRVPRPCPRVCPCSAWNTYSPPYR